MLRRCRVFIKPLKRYARKDEPIFYSCVNGEEGSWKVIICDGDQHREFTLDKDKQELEIEYATDIYDKKSRLIYEGDLIRYPEDEALGPAFGSGVVVFHKNEFLIKIEELPNGTIYVKEFYDYNTPEEDFEVIGNVHQDDKRKEYIMTNNKIISVEGENDNDGEITIKKES